MSDVARRLSRSNTASRCNRNRLVGRERSFYDGRLAHLGHTPAWVRIILAVTICRRQKHGRESKKRVVTTGGKTARERSRSANTTKRRKRRRRSSRDERLSLTLFFSSRGREKRRHDYGRYVTSSREKKLGRFSCSTTQLVGSLRSSCMSY